MIKYIIEYLKNQWDQTIRSEELESTKKTWSKRAHEKQNKNRKIFRRRTVLNFSQRIAKILFSLWDESVCMLQKSTE